MKAKVIIAQATAETVGFLYELVKRMAEKTAIKAYPSVDYQAVFFPVDKHDLYVVLSLSDSPVQSRANQPLRQVGLRNRAVQHPLEIHD